MGLVTTHPEAQRELDEAIAWYEQARLGLGREFRDEVLEAVARIAENPRRHAVRKYEVRRANLKRFPYHVNYLAEGSDVVIVSIAHDRRSPFYWRRRLDKGSH